MRSVPPPAARASWTEHSRRATHAEIPDRCDRGAGRLPDARHVQMRIAATSKPGCGTDRPFAEGGERATLWMSTSAEFRSSAEGIYRSALLGLQQGLADAGLVGRTLADRRYLRPAARSRHGHRRDGARQQRAAGADAACSTPVPAISMSCGTPGSRNARRPRCQAPRHSSARRANLKDAQGRPVRVFLITNRDCGCAPRPPRPPARSRTTRSPTCARSGWILRLLEDDLMLKGERPGWGNEKLPAPPADRPRVPHRAECRR